MNYLMPSAGFAGAVPDGVLRVEESGHVMFVPADTMNRDWREYQEWLAAGHSPAAPEPA
jgi:hypothetical protein